MSRSDPALLPEPLRALVQAELRPGEGIRWLEQPIPARLARSAWPVVLLAIPWTGFALFWVWMAAQASCPNPSAEARMFPLFGVPFVLVGLGMFSSPYWVVRRARRTVYLLTDRRAVVLCAGWGSRVTVRSFEPEKLGDLRREQNADGSGDLVFGEDVRVGAKGRTRTVPYGFLAVCDVREAEEQVQSLARRAAPA